MNAKDLMIGDWVCFDGDTSHECPVQIDGISKEEAGVDGDWYDIWEPIPLTPEILEKNFEQISIEDISAGYQDKDFYTYDKLYRIKESDHYQFSQLEEILSCNGVMLRYEYRRFFIDVEASDCDFGAYGATFKEIHYVHELQHALKLCGIEKEVVL